MGAGDELGEETDEIIVITFYPEFTPPRKPFGNRGPVRGKWEPKNCILTSYPRWREPDRSHKGNTPRGNL